MSRHPGEPSTEPSRTRVRIVCGFTVGGSKLELMFNIISGQKSPIACRNAQALIRIGGEQDIRGFLKNPSSELSGFFAITGGPFSCGRWER